MTPTTKKLVFAAAFAVCVAAGGGMALAGPADPAATGDDDEAPLTGDVLQQAGDAALEAAAEYGEGGTVTSTEGPDEEAYYEVTVTLADGTEVDVDVDESYAVLGTPEVEGQDDGDGDADDGANDTDDDSDDSGVGDD
jgi:hypothetical protein